MAEEGTSYKLTIEDELSGLDSAISKLEQAEKTIPKVDAEVKGLGDSMKHAGEASGGAEEKVRALNKKLAELKAPGEIKRLTKEIEEFGKREGVFTHFTHAALEPFLERAKQVAEFEFIRLGVDALIEAPGEIIEKLAELGKEMVLTAAKAERLDQSFSLTLGQEGAEEVLGWIERISDKTEFTDDQLKGWSSELLRAGVKMADVDKFLTAGLDTAAKSTNKLEGMSAAISALSRAQLTGRVETRALRGLSIGVDELKSLPQFQGLNDKQLHKKMEEGAISKDDLLTLIAGKGGVLGDLGLVAAKTFEAQLKNVREIPDQVFQGLYKTAGFQELGNFLGRIFENFGPETELGTHAFEALADSLDIVAGKLQSIDLEVVADKVGDAFEELPPVIETITSAFQAAADVIGFFGDAVQTVNKVFDFFESPFEKAAKKKGEAEEFRRGRDPVDVRFEQEQRQKLRDARAARARGEVYVDPALSFGPQLDPLERARKRKEQIREEMRASGRAGGDGLKQGATDRNPVLAAAGASMGEALKQGTNESLEIHSPSRALFRAGAYAGDGFVEGIESRRAEIEDAMSTAFSPPADGPEVGALAGGGSGVMLKVDVGGVTIMSAEGANAHELADDFVAALDRVLPGALTRVLEGVRARAGG